MAHYFFNVQDGGPQRDETGSDCATLEDVRRAAMSFLPALASEQIPLGDDRRMFSLVARDDAGNPIYSATLCFVGFWLKN